MTSSETEWNGADAFRGEFDAMQGMEPAFDVGEAIGKFAPLVRLHPDDRFRPVSVGWYLDRTQLRLHRKLRRDRHALHRGEVTPETVPLAHLEGQESDGGACTDFFLQIPNDGAESEVRRGSLRSAECYVHVRPVLAETDLFDIQYWFLYAYNGGADRHTGHEGDWEHVTVRVSNRPASGGPVAEHVYYSAHSSGNGTWRQPASTPGSSGGYDATADGRPIVYSALGSHASYPVPGLFERGFLKPVDRTANGGPVWDTRLGLVLAARNGRPTPGNEWLTYSGRWGEIGTWWWKWAGNGPRGPAFQRSWYVE